LGNGFQLDQRPIIGFFAGRRQTDRNRNLAAPFLNTANRRGCALKNDIATVLSTALIQSGGVCAQNARPGSTISFGLVGSVVFDTTTDELSLNSTWTDLSPSFSTNCRSE